MFKKVLTVLFGLCIVLALVACSSTTSSTASRKSSSSTSQASASAGSSEASLAVGLLKLEGTAQAVKVDQAKTLLPLWKAVKSLSASDTSSAAEMQALNDQINASLTTDQAQAIAQLNLTDQNLTSTVDELGILAGQAATPAASTSNQGGGPGGPGGAPPDMMGGPGGVPGAGASTTSGQNTTSAASSSVLSKTTRAALYNAVIKMLAARVNG